MLMGAARETVTRAAGAWHEPAKPASCSWKMWDRGDGRGMTDRQGVGESYAGEAHARPPLVEQVLTMFRAGGGRWIFVRAQIAGVLGGRQGSAGGTPTWSSALSIESRVHTGHTHLLAGHLLRFGVPAKGEANAGRQRDRCGACSVDQRLDVLGAFNVRQDTVLGAGGALEVGGDQIRVGIKERSARAAALSQ